MISTHKKPGSAKKNGRLILRGYRGLAQILPGVGLFLQEPPDGGTAILLAGTGEAA